VVNSSFENPVLGDGGLVSNIGGYTTTVAPGWGLQGPGGIYNPPQTYGGTGQDGANVGYLRSGSLFGQWITGPMVVGTTYTLSALVAGQISNTQNLQYQFSFVEGLSTDLSTYHTLATSTPGSVTEGVFNPESFSYTVTAAAYPSSVLGIQIFALGTAGNVFFDKVGLDATTVSAVPEPEIYAMMGIGLGFLGWIGRRKKLKTAADA